MQFQIIVIIFYRNQLIIYYVSDTGISFHILTYPPLQYPYEVGLLFFYLLNVYMKPRVVK